MRFTSLQDAILNQVIEVAANSGRGQAEPFSDDYSARWPILKDRAGNRIAGAEFIDFHNSIVS
jgi:hypothetical protein